MLRLLDKLPHAYRIFVFFALIILVGAGPLHAQKKTDSGGSWKFAVSGDSRNCGDIVMPAIAQQVRGDGAAFYWHLGDYRLMSNFDQDYRQIYPTATIDDYLANAWPDFIQHQMKPFGDLPVFLGIGNHELVTPKTRPQYIAQFADWLDRPVIRQQRLADNPDDHLVKTYYHWIERGVDFITMDNASPDMFDDDQMTWLHERVGEGREKPLHSHRCARDACLSARWPFGRAQHERLTARADAAGGLFTRNWLLSAARQRRTFTYWPATRILRSITSMPPPVIRKTKS